MVRIFVFYLSLGFVCLGFSQTKSYQFVHLSNNDGLSQSSVIAIHQDNLGQIWIGTRDGLNKYDGNKFTIYRTNENNPNSISNNDILSIEEDNEGFLWIGTYNGLNKYNPKADKFTRYFHKEGNTSLADNTIWNIKKRSNGQIWVGTSNGLSIYDDTANIFKNYLNTSKRPVANQVISILESSQGNMFVGTGAGVYKVSDSQETIAFSLLEGTEDLFVQDLQEEISGNILIATRSKSVLIYDKNKNTVNPYIEVDVKDLNSNNVRQLLFDDKMNLWVGTYNGLKIVDGNKSITTLKADIDNESALSKNSVKCLFKDKKGSIWIGTYYGGVNIWDETNVNFKSITQNQKGKGLNYTVVSSIEKYKNNFFFGTEGGGVNVWNSSFNSYQYLTKNNSKLSDDNIKALSVIEDKLWIGTFKSGLDIYDLRLKQFTKEPLPEDLVRILENTGVYAIKKDAFNSIWIGTFGRGLFRFNTKTKEFYRYASSDVVNALSSNLVRSICAD